MKKVANLFLVLFSCALLLSACDQNDGENKVIEEEINTNDQSLEKGQIPPEVKFLEKIHSAEGDAFKFISLLKDYKASYETTNFYNNLFEVTSNVMFTSENFENLGASELQFLLDEMRSVESNVANIKNIALLMTACKTKGIITKKELMDFADEFSSKNKLKLEEMNWTDVSDRDNKLAELNKEIGNLVYQHWYLD